MTSSSRGGAAQVGRGVQPLIELGCTLGRDAEALLGPVLGGVVGLDEAVALESVQRGVHLAHVEGPDVAGAGLELLTELQPVLGALAQQGRAGRAERSRWQPQYHTAYTTR